MNSLTQRLNKPEYWFRPRQILKRLAYRSNSEKAGLETSVKLPWGVDISVAPAELLGKSLLTLGVHELAISEVIWRLTDPGDWCIDAGANIGYMTSIMSVKSGPAGLVKSFEPHPKVFEKLQRNVTGWNQSVMTSRIAHVELNQFALGSGRATMRLCEPDGFSTNEGIASLSKDGTSGYQVQVERLDELPTSDSGYSIMKVDVEGAELDLLQGSEKLLAARKIRDIVYEDFATYPSPSATLLLEHGYTIFRLNKQLLGPQIWEPTDPRAASSSLSYEPANYLATVQPDRARELMCPRGWKCLRG